MVNKKILLLSLSLVTIASNVWCMGDEEKLLHQNMYHYLRGDRYLENAIAQRKIDLEQQSKSGINDDTIKLQLNLLNPYTLSMHHARIISHPMTLQCPEKGDRGHTCQESVCDATTFKNKIVPEIRQLYKDFMKADCASINKEVYIAGLGIASAILGLCTTYKACTTKSCALAGISGGLFSVAGLTYYNTRKMCKADPFLAGRYKAMTAVNKALLKYSTR